MPCLRIAYDGRLFSGSQRQPEVRTVENEILDFLTDAGYISSPDELEAFRMASRTDKGVSANMNLLNIIHSKGKDIRKNNLLERMNDRLRGIWITGYSDKEYKQPLEKTYHYFTGINTRDEGKLKEVCDTFSGRHDFGKFSKFDPRKETEREIRMGYLIIDGVLVLTFRGRGFLWQMCRRLSSATMSCLKGELEMGDIDGMLRGNVCRKPSPAPAENLLLFSIEGDIEFIDTRSGIDAKRDYYLSMISNANVKRAMGMDIVSNL